MKQYEIVASALTVLPEGESIFSEMATTIRLEDEGAGCFVIVEQPSEREGKEGVSFCEEEWPLIQQAIEKLIIVCANRNKQVHP